MFEKILKYIFAILISMVILVQALHQLELYDYLSSHIFENISSFLLKMFKGFE